jgi:hypothetical protein
MAIEGKSWENHLMTGGIFPEGSGGHPFEVLLSRAFFIRSNSASSFSFFFNRPT